MGGVIRCGHSMIRIRHGVIWCGHGPILPQRPSVPGGEGP